MAASKSKVDDFFNDLGLTAPEKHQVAVALRKEIKRLAKAAEERMMYGGVLYYLEESFCGIFSYKTHVTLEFSEGYRFDDRAGVLEGAGKYRRHIKFKQVPDVRDKHAAAYIEQAIKLVNS
ncbi:DUF1801 domain-containing protein [Verminephrobacter aporrectodeae subsp. tuberculatae]|uniref:DUF1801 domain-containing protein n=1 Tax=Verminephrobacter aporrectodeae subsp. tuberculatae TaxID=1110392 RepID=A0ABT3KS70_9BURK|nr:DUF1801 domain-containing protein [Verminephrobacter aporrectodeae]MCW5321148.1 DUF1801 domain-containing protein [Verminephrobacter aporrectodeae subsp. tuberculatae]